MHLQDQVEMVARHIAEVTTRRGGRLAAVTLAIPDASVEDRVVIALGRALFRLGLAEVEIAAHPEPGPIRVVRLEMVR